MILLRQEPKVVVEPSVSHPAPAVESSFAPEYVSTLDTNARACDKVGAGIRPTPIASLSPGDSPMPSSNSPK